MELKRFFQVRKLLGAYVVDEIEESVGGALLNDDNNDRRKGKNGKIHEIERKIASSFVRDLTFLLLFTS
jgi:hypothetical protein